MILPTTVQTDGNSKQFKALTGESQSGDLPTIHRQPTQATDDPSDKALAVVADLPLPKGCTSDAAKNFSG